MKFDLHNLPSKLQNLSLVACLLCFTLLSSSSAFAQTYGDSFSFDREGITYTFDYTVVCSGDGTSADVTATFVTPPGVVPGLAPQMHLGGGNFVGMSGSNPYTFTITALTGCDFNFQFWMAYAGGLFSSDFLTPANAPLPISLTDFSASRQGAKAVQLDWVTATEENSDHFDVERSADGVNWEQINQISAAVYSNTNLAYTYLDADVQLGSAANSTLYYRLQLTDQDGTYEYSNVLSVDFAGSSNSVVSVYPNPSTNRVNVDLTDIDMEAGDVQVVMYDASGKLMRERSVSSNVVETIDVTLLPSATYTIVLRQGTQTIYQTKVIKAN